MAKMEIQILCQTSKICRAGKQGYDRNRKTIGTKRALPDDV